MEKVPFDPAVLGTQVAPGPCDPVYGCPPPTEIVCIDVPKVYDFCFQTETFNSLCVNLPQGCTGNTATCTVSSVTCREVSRQQLTGGFANVTILVTVMRSITVANNGVTECTFDTSHSFLKTVTLCAPTGTTIDCTAPSSTCGPCFIANGQVCCNVIVCLLIESTAVVKLLVPAYGFCVPAECAVLPPELPCPPETLFPAQCVPAVR